MIQAIFALFFGLQSSVLAETTGTTNLLIVVLVVLAIIALLIWIIKR